MLFCFVCLSVVNVWFFSVVVSSINFLVSFLLIPLLWIPGMGTDTPRTTFPHLWGGVRCIFQGVSTEDPAAQCDRLWWITLLQVASNVAVNLLTLQLVRSGSALLLQVVSGVQLPLCNLVYAWTLVMGSALVVPMTNYMWIGLSLVTVGFFIYSFLSLGGAPSTRQVAPEPQHPTPQPKHAQLQQDPKLPRPGSAALSITRTQSASSKGLQEASEQSYRPTVVL